jgi:hypothetical protein
MNTPDISDPLPPGNAPSPVLDLKAFVPSQNYDLSKQFYLDLGFMMNWGSNEIAEFHMSRGALLVQPPGVRSRSSGPRQRRNLRVVQRTRASQRPREVYVLWVSRYSRANLRNPVNRTSNPPVNPATSIKLASCNGRVKPYSLIPGETSVSIAERELAN